MDIMLSVEIGEDRRLIIDLPADTPIGQADLIIKPHMDNQPHGVSSSRESIRARLLAAGKLVTDIHAPEGTMPLTIQERQRIGQLPAGSRDSQELIDEDRGSY